MSNKQNILALPLAALLTLTPGAQAGDLDREARFGSFHAEGASASTIGSIDEDSTDLDQAEVTAVTDAHAQAFLARVGQAAPADVMSQLALSFKSAARLVRTPEAGDATLIWPFSSKPEVPAKLTRFYNQGQALEYGTKIDSRLDLEGEESERNKFKANLLQAVVHKDVSVLGDIYEGVKATMLAWEVKQISGKRWVRGDKSYLGEENDSYTREAQEALHYQMVSPDGQVYVPAGVESAAPGSELRLLPNPLIVVPDREVKKGETWQSRTLTGKDHQFLADCKITFTYKGIKRRLGGWFGWLFGWGHHCHYVEGTILDQAGEEIGEIESSIDTVSGQLLEEYIKFDRSNFQVDGKKARARLKAHTWFLKTLKPGEDSTLVPGVKK